ncbi:PE-PPE domain-containing protein [Kitasatospora sp. NPDC096147]|uniref:PE-PPE domain-containing protein n=1 Tax=Kitasatospora sp. NPDC096147 TaxID=3364093 RepID=UPI0038221149
MGGADDQDQDQDHDHPADHDYPTDVDEGGVTELVVHGVGGSGPAEVLDDPEARQVTGSKLAGIWRGRDAQPSGRHREVYSWGGLTSRSWATALWFLLLPFAFVNTAGWMAHGTGRQVRFQQATVRIIALCVTATYLLFLTHVLVDQAAWQCLAVANCRAQPFWHALQLQGRPYLAVAVAALLPALLVLLLHVGTSPNRRWEAGDGSAGENDRPGHRDLARAELTDPGFWEGGAYSTRHRTVHTCSALLLLTLVLLRTARTGGRATGLLTVLELLTVLGLLLFTAAALGDRPRARLAGGRISRRVSCTSTTMLLAGAMLVCAVQPSSRRHGATGISGAAIGMPDLLELFNLLLLVLYTAGLALLAGAWRAKGSAGQRGLPRLPPAFTTVAVSSGLLFAIWSGVALSAAHWLSPPGPADGGAATQVGILPGSEVLARYSIDGMVLLVLWFGVVWYWHRLRHPVDLTEELDHWERRTPGLRLRAPAPHPESPRGLWLAEVLRRKRNGELLLRRMEGLTSGAAVLLAASAVTFGICYLLAWTDGPKPDPTTVWAGLPAPSAALAGAILVLGPVLLLLLVRESLADQNTRRVVGIVWDVATFWPRAFHPYAPPSYAEQAVPQLAERVRHLTSQGGSVVLLGHSQGAVIVTATVARLAGTAPETGARLSVVTYGNPVPRLYRRWFPRHLADHLTAARLRAFPTPPSWHNFHRATDPFGGQRLTTPGITDVWLPDPPTAERRPGSELPVIRGHHHRGYVRQSAFAARLDRETTRLNGP